MAKKKEVIVSPARLVVVVYWQSSVTGERVEVVQHDCRDRHHARHLLAELAELAMDLEESGLLPGLSAVGYEVGEVVEMPQADRLAKVAAAARSGECHTAAWWAEQIGLMSEGGE